MTALTTFSVVAIWLGGFACGVGFTLWWIK